MRLTDEMIKEDDKRFVRQDMLNEFKYCGKEVPLRKSITNDDIRFYAWLCRSAYALLKEQEAVVPNTGHWIYKKYDDMFMCSCCEKYSIRNNYPFCHWCGAKMDMDDEVE